MKVSAKEFAADPTGWNEWGEDVTSADGTFTVSKEKDRSKRLFRVRVMFKDDDLKIYPENSTLLTNVLTQGAKRFTGGAIADLFVDGASTVIEQAVEQFTRLTYDVPWYTVYEDGSGEKHVPSRVDFGDLMFGAHGKEELNDTWARRHAEIWFLTKKMMTAMADMGPGLGFTAKKAVAIKHPHDNPWIGDAVEASYFNPFNDTGYILKNSQRDHFNADTLWHELGHGWAYQRTTGENGLAWQLLIHGDTHGRQNQPWVACHEAIAEYLKNVIYRDLIGSNPTSLGDIEGKRVPYSRRWLKDQGIGKLADVEHYEHGWLAFFNMLTCNRLEKMDLNASGDYAVATITPVGSNAPDLSPADLLQVIQSGPGELARSMPCSDMTLSRFLDRAIAILPQLESKHKTAYLRLIDPGETVQPKDVFGPTPVVNPVGPDAFTAIGNRPILR